MVTGELFMSGKIDVREIDALVDAQNGRITPSIYTDPDIYELELETCVRSYMVIPMP